MKKIVFLFYVLSLLPAGACLAQQHASVNGYVTDAETGETLIGANIILSGKNRGTATNTSGYYSLTNLEPGKVTLAVSYLGYTRYQQTITLDPGAHRRLNVALQPNEQQLKELLVESEREQNDEHGIGRAQLETETIKKMPSAFQADVFRALQHLPGVKSASDFSSGLYIRGGSPDQTLILLDRTTVYNPTHFFGFFSTFNPDAIKNVQLYKGGYPAKFGGRLGSVLSIYNKEGNQHKVDGSVTVGMLASRAMVEGPFKHGSWMLAVRRSTLEPVLAILKQSADNIPDSFYFYDINGKGTLQAGDNDKVDISFYAGTDNLKFPFADDAGVNLNYGNQTLSSSWNHIFSNQVFSHFTLTGSHYFNYPSFDIAGTSADRSNDIYDFSAQGALEYIPGNHHTITGGFKGGSLTLNVKNRFDNNQNYSSHIHSLYGSAYLQDEWRINDHWTAMPGLRLNGFAKGSYLRLAPRLSVEYRPSSRIRLQGAVGRYYQFLTLASNEAFSGFDTWFTTSDGVPPSYGNQYVLGIKTIPWHGYGFNVEVYYRSMNDLFEQDPFIPDKAGLSYDDTFRFGDGYAYGSEFLFRRKIGRLTGFLGYTFGTTRRKFPPSNRPLEEGAARYYPPKFDRINDINLVLEYKLSSRWSTTTAFNFATGQPYTRPLGRTAAFHVPTSNSEKQQLIVGKINASRLPAYHRLDISFSRRGTFFGLGKAEWQFQLINAYSHRNVWFYNYDLDKNPAERDEIPLLPVLPTISYTVDF